MGTSSTVKRTEKGTPQGAGDKGEVDASVAPEACLGSQSLVRHSIEFVGIQIVFDAHIPKLFVAVFEYPAFYSLWIRPNDLCNLKE